MNGTPRDWIEDNLLERLFIEIGIKETIKELEAIITLRPERQDFTRI